MPGGEATHVPTLRRLDATTLHDRVYGELRRAIMAGVYRPGEKLSMSGLADSFGTSLMPVREALRRLAADNAVQILPKRGVMIPLVSRARFVELDRVRLVLEGMATEMAATRITTEDIAQLQRLCLQMNAFAAARGRWYDYVLGNYEFHFTIYRAGGSEVLLPIIESLWLQSGPLRSLYAEVGVGKPRGQHEEIIAALQAGDPGLARLAMEQDIQTGTDFFCGVASFSDESDPATRSSA